MIEVRDRDFKRYRLLDAISSLGVVLQRYTREHSTNCGKPSPAFMGIKYAEHHFMNLILF